jgi:hypothetical protein
VQPLGVSLEVFCSGDDQALPNSPDADLFRAGRGRQALADLGADHAEAEGLYGLVKS